MNRRQFLACGAASFAAATTHAPATDAPVSRPVRLGIVGLGNRGRYLLQVLLKQPGVQFKALCDLDEPSLKAAADLVTSASQPAPALYLKAPNDYTALLRRDDLDAVLIATPTKWHCPMAIAAMKAGKHVGSEVPAGFELDELQELVRTKETTGRRYMLLENYLYQRVNMQILNMTRAGAFGEPYYAECGYIHDCRFMLFKKDGSLDWWGEWAARKYGSDYPTHGLGPVCKWLGINEGDRMEYCTSMMTRPRVLKEYAVKRFGPDSPQAGIDWALGEFVSTLIHTASGRVIRLDYDVNSPRPGIIPLLLQGTKGIFDSRAGVYFESVGNEQWEGHTRYRQQYEHGYWRRDGTRAEQTGHGGGDFFALRDFVEMVRNNREPWIDVYDAAAWSVLYHCSHQSISRRSESVEIPDFTGGKWKDPQWRKNSHPA